MKPSIGFACLILAMFAGGPKCLAKGAQEPPSPVLSAKGLKRVRENLKIVSENLEDSQKNLAASQNNLKVIEDEIKDLDRLEKEHVELRTNYDTYLAKAEAEMKKNDEAYKKVDAELQKLGPEDPKPASTAASNNEPTDREKLLREKADRDAWKSDAIAKTKKIQELRSKLIASQRDILSRREPLRNQRQTWTSRTKDYENLVTLFQQKKAEIEKLTKK